MVAIPRRASSVGAIARDILTPGATFEVAAVFEHSAYLQLAGGFVCIGVSAIGDGPINILLDTPAPLPFASLGFHRAAEGHVALDHFTISNGPEIDIATATIWSPPATPRWTPASIAAGLTLLKAEAELLVVQDGLSCLVFGGAGDEHQTPTARAAADTLAELHAALPAALRAERAETLARPAVLLLGLGPGLTPSGDDLLGGMMLALSALGHVPLRNSLWDVLAPELGDLTHEISAMHLALAADGLGSAVIHQALAAIIGIDQADRPNDIAAAGRIGHTSGWDTLAGIALVLEAWLAAKPM